MAKRESWFEDEIQHEPTQFHMPSYTTRYKQAPNRPRFISQHSFHSQHNFHSPTMQSDEFLPQICQSAPLIAKRHTNRDTEHIIASSHWEKKEETCYWYSKKSSKDNSGITLSAKTTKTIMSIDTEVSAQFKRSHPYTPESTTTSRSLTSCRKLYIVPPLSGDCDEPNLIRQTSKRQQDAQSILQNSESNIDPIKDDTSEKSSSTTKEVTTHNRRYSSILFIAVALWVFSILGQKVPMEKVLDDILVEMRSALYGQHIAIEVTEGSFHHALVSNDTKVVTLLMIGPSGNGKSFTRAMMQKAFTSNSFAIARVNFDTNRIDFTDVCSQWRNYQNLAFIIDDIPSSFKDVWKLGDILTASKHCSSFNKIVIIMTSSLYSDDIKQYMLNQCKFNNERLKIKSTDVIEHISKSWTIDRRLHFESAHDKHVVLPMVFLPLDIDHVKMCIVKALSLRGVDKEQVNSISKEVMDLMEFYPQCGMKYPEFGCKLVSSRVDYIIKSRADVQKVKI